jgi:hypothetical protein
MLFGKKSRRSSLPTPSATKTATNSANPKPRSASVGLRRPTDESGFRSRATTMPRSTAVAINWYVIVVSVQLPYCDRPADFRSESSRFESGLSRTENPTASPRKVVK